MSNALAPFLDLLNTFVRSLMKQFGSRARIETLDDALRGAAREHQALQEALAHAAMTERREADRLDALNTDIAELEGRAVLAIQGGRQDLAQRAAESLVMLETQRVAQIALCAETRATSRSLRLRIDTDRLRLQKLDYGRRLARIRAIAPSQSPASPLADAEDALATINATDAVARHEAQPGQIAQELADAGFGPSHQGEVAAVLERLQAAAQVSSRIAPIPLDRAVIQQSSQL